MFKIQIYILSIKQSSVLLIKNKVSLLQIPKASFAWINHFTIRYCLTLFYYLHCLKLLNLSHLIVHNLCFLPNQILCFAQTALSYTSLYPAIVPSTDLFMSKIWNRGGVLEKFSLDKGTLPMEETTHAKVGKGNVCPRYRK